MSLPSAVRKRNADRLRVLLFALLLLAVYPINSAPVLGVLFLLTVAGFWVFRVPLSGLKLALYGNLFLAFVVISLLLLDFKNNWETALVIFLKANTIFGFTNLLIIPLGVVRLAKALEGLGISKKFTLLLFLSYRYIHSLGREYETMKKALACRGFEPKTSLRTYRVYGYLLGMLTVKTYIKAKEVYKAMLCRGL